MNNPTPASDVILRTVGLEKTFFRGTAVPVLQGVDLHVNRGEFLSIIGMSGSGKSTLLHLIGLLDRPDGGQIHFEGARVDHQNNRFRDRFRNEVVGFVFQFYHLLPELSTLENVMLPQMIRQPARRFFSRRREISQHARELLDRVGLGHRMHHRPHELSGGEMQRAVIARALLARPVVLLADEPTGNLDPQTGETILQLLIDLQRETDLTVIMVTHNYELADRTDRVLRLVGGRLEHPVALTT